MRKISTLKKKKKFFIFIVVCSFSSKHSLLVFAGSYQVEGVMLPKISHTTHQDPFLQVGNKSQPLFLLS
jgi:hypothetical protein